MERLLNIARLVKACGKVDGRKKIQKMVYILQQAGHPFREEFGYLHYGPYSSELKAEIDSLVTSTVGLLEETPQPIIDHTSYVYKPTQKLEHSLESLGIAGEPAWADLARTLNKLNASQLEAISTILFLRERGFEGEQLESKFKDLKPDIANLFDQALEQAKMFAGRFGQH